MAKRVAPQPPTTMAAVTRQGVKYVRGARVDWPVGHGFVLGLCGGAAVADLSHVANAL